MSIYRTIYMILRYDTIHTIYTLYCMIHENLRYVQFYDTIQFIRYAYCIVWFMRTYDMPIRYITFYTWYDTYCISYNTDNYACNFRFFILFPCSRLLVLDLYVCMVSKQRELHPMAKDKLLSNNFHYICPQTPNIFFKRQKRST